MDVTRTHLKRGEMMLRYRRLVTVTVVLALFGTSRANLSLVADRLELDALVGANAQWLRAEQAGLAQSGFAFGRVVALAGLIGYLSPAVSLRLSGDVGSLQPQDLYTDLHWRSGLLLRAGQFLLPLGMDAMTEPDSQVLAGSSFLVSYAKPNGIRDIGAMGSWQTSRFSASAAVVNGSGANAGDNNDRKDLCGRLAVRPLADLDAVLALRAYYGWPDSLWQSAAVEARLKRGPLTLQAELQNGRSQYARNNAAYLLAAWDVGMLEPVGRFDLVLPQRMRAEWMVVVGFNARPLSGHFRAMLDCSYHRNYDANWAVFGFDFRLQATI
jgi:hypothetical protein